MTAAPIVHGGGVAAAAAVYGGAPETWLDLSTGLNPCPPSLPDIPHHVWHRLPDADLLDKAQTRARGYYQSPVQPLAVPGTQAVIQLLPRLVPKGQRVAILGPTYGEYERSFRAYGVDVDVLDTLDGIRADHGMVVLVNPNNPTGRIIPKADVAALYKKLSGWNTKLVIDEAFADTMPDVSSVQLVTRESGPLVLRSFGKFFGLAGVRLGFAIGPDALLHTINDWLGPWAVSGPALHCAAALMSKNTAAIRTVIEERRAALENTLAHAGLQIAGGTPLFALVDHSDANALHDHLCRRHILVRKFDYAPRWLRFGLPPNSQADQRLAEALA